VVELVRCFKVVPFGPMFSAETGLIGGKEGLIGGSTHAQAPRPNGPPPPLPLVATNRTKPYGEVGMARKDVPEGGSFWSYSAHGELMVCCHTHHHSSRN
jgi:hypothetical protein